jgi:hypothetical protein
MRSANSRYLSILDELQYLPALSLSDRILHDSIKKSVETIGKSFSKALLHNMGSFYGLSEHELLTNYDLFEGSLHRILGKAGEPIIRLIKAEMLRYTIMNGSEITASDILDPNLTVSYVLKDIRDREVCDFVRDIPQCEHIALLYRSENVKNKILSEFFDYCQTEGDDCEKKLPVGLISIKETPIKLRADLLHISYDELLNAPRRDKIKEKLAAWINYVHSFNKSQRFPTRIANEDATMWLRNGFDAHDGLHLEQMFSTLTCDVNASMLCAFDISKIEETDVNTMLKSLLSAHDYVILDEPLVVYRKAIRRTRTNKMNNITTTTWIRPIKEENGVSKG